MKAATLLLLLVNVPGWAQTLVLAEPVHHHDWWAREPMVVEHPNGTLFVSGYSGGSLRQPPNLWKSSDRGRTWSRVNVGRAQDGALGESDVDLAVAPDGTLYFASLGFNGATHKGEYVALGVSRDAGQSWKWTMLSHNAHDDRPWVKAAPDGTAHVIWNDGNGVLIRSTHDRGATWSEAMRIHDHGGSSHLAVGPKGEIAVRIVPLSAAASQYDSSVDLIAVSLDGGKTWQKRDAPGEREWSPKFNEPIPRWVEPLAWDAEGSLFSFWTNLKGLWLARSRDKGEIWTTWQLLQMNEVSYYPYLTAGRRAGKLAGTWFSGREDTLQAHLAVFQLGDGGSAPRVIQSPPFRPDSWVQVKRDDPNSDLVRTAAGEYIPVIFLRDGDLGVVSPLNDFDTRMSGFSWWRATPR